MGGDEAAVLRIAERGIVRPVPCRARHRVEGNGPRCRVPHPAGAARVAHGPTSVVRRPVARGRANRRSRLGTAPRRGPHRLIDRRWVVSEDRRHGRARVERVQRQRGDRVQAADRNPQAPIVPATVRVPCLASCRARDRQPVTDPHRVRDQHRDPSVVVRRLITPRGARLGLGSSVLTDHRVAANRAGPPGPARGGPSRVVAPACHRAGADLRWERRAVRRIHRATPVPRPAQPRLGQCPVALRGLT